MDKRKILVMLLGILVVVFTSLAGVYADSFDTNYSSSEARITYGTKKKITGDRKWKNEPTNNLYGTRYVIRYYDSKENRYVSVPQQYFINHVYDDSKEKMYLGADQTVKSGRYNYILTEKQNSISGYGDKKTRRKW